MKLKLIICFCLIDFTRSARHSKPIICGTLFKSKAPTPQPSPTTHSPVSSPPPLSSPPPAPTLPPAPSPLPPSPPPPPPPPPPLPPSSPPLPPLPPLPLPLPPLPPLPLPLPPLPPPLLPPHPIYPPVIVFPPLVPSCVWHCPPSICSYNCLWSRTTELPWDENVPLVLNPGIDHNSNNYSCSIFRHDTPICSGVVISKTFVLLPCNACLRNGKKIYIPEDYEVQYGHFHGRSEGNVMEVMSYPVRRIFRHPECYIHNQINPDNDIGIIQIRGGIALPNIYYAKIPSGRIFPIDISLYNFLSNLRIFNVLATDRSEAIWTILTKVVDPSFCLRMLSSFGMKNTCAAYQHVGGALRHCETDIGASLSVRRRTEETVFGLLITKYSCGRARGVAGFVSLKYHVKWIREIVKKYSQGEEFV